jgi:hypothetical protein
MSSKLAVAALATMTIALSAPAIAQDRHYDRDYRHDHSYHGRGGHYRERCGGGNGAVGTVAGGVGGAVVGNALGGGTLGTVAGGVGGALLGRHLDKKHTRSRNGC